MLKVFTEILHVVIKLVLIPVAMVLTVANYMLKFAGGVVCFITKMIGIIFVMGGILVIVMEPHNTTMGWQAILIGTLFGGVPAFLRDFGSAMLSRITGTLRRV